MKVSNDLSKYLNEIISRSKSEGEMQQLDYQYIPRFISELKERGYMDKPLRGFSRGKKSFWGSARFNEDFKDLKLSAFGEYDTQGPFQIRFQTLENSFSYTIPRSFPGIRFVRFSFAKNGDGLYLVQRTTDWKDRWVDDMETVIIQK